MPFRCGLNRRISLNLGGRGPSSTYQLLLLVALIRLIWTNRIDLSNQQLEVVPRNLDVTVTELILTRNTLIRLNVTSFDIYVMLTKIDLYLSRTEIIEEGTFNKQDKLVYLGLLYCPIKQLPQIFGPSVHTLETWSMGHRFDPKVLSYPYFSAFEKLEVLSLTGVDISNLDPTTLPPNLGLFYLASSSDMMIFPNISNSLHLYKIIASRGQIEYIPQEHVSNLPKLYDLVLNENRLIAFPNLSHLKGIIHVVVTNNKLLSVPTEHIAGLPRLRDLFLANNLITAMPNVSYLPKLQTIRLSNNLLTFVPGSCLWGLPILRKLELQSNQITSIGDISSVPGLVFLHDNHLSTLPEMYNMQLSELTLRDNPWSCNVSICWLRMWPWMKTPPTLDAFLCSGPLQLNGTLVMRVHPVVLKCYNGRFTPLCTNTKSHPETRNF